MATLYLGVRVPSYTRVKLEGVNLNDSVRNLRTTVSENTKLDIDSFDMIYCGHKLKDSEPIKSYGITNGIMVHVLKKKEKVEPAQLKVPTDEELTQLAFAIRSMLLSSHSRASLQRLCKPEVIETIIAATPGLGNDPIALGIMHDPDLIFQLGQMDTLRKLVTTHPALIDVIHHIAASIHEDSTAGNGQSSFMSGFNYSLEGLSDDEEMDSSQSSDSQARIGGAFDLMGESRPSFSGITQAQLAAALAAASGGASTSNATPSSSGMNIITNEMFSQAMQQAVASISNTSTTPQSSVSQPSATTATTSAPVQLTDIGNPATEEDAATRQLILSQLRQMRELGIVDDALSIRALAATDGDVQSAVEMIFNGWIGEDQP